MQTWMQRLVTLLAVVPALCPSFLFAQGQPELITDRPDFTESPAVVPTGRVQLETGLTWEHHSGEDFAAGPEALLRWTPWRHLELRFGLPDYARGERASGFGDSSVGVKVPLGVWGGLSMATIATLSLPTGEDERTSDTFDPELLLTVGRDVGRSSEAGIQVTVGRADDRFVWGSTLVAATPLGGRWGTFLELVTHASGNDLTSVVVHHGYTVALAPTLQLDVHGGVGLTKESPDVFLGIGWSGRF